MGQKIFRKIKSYFAEFLGLSATNANAQPLDYEIRETIPIPPVYSGAYLMHVGDMDGDGIIDIVLKKDDTIYIRERDGGTFVTRYTIERSNIKPIISPVLFMQSTQQSPLLLCL